MEVMKLVTMEVRMVYLQDTPFEAIKRTNTFALPDLPEGVFYKYKPSFRGRLQLMMDSAEAAGNAAKIIPQGDRLKRPP
jgi:hypothetical protein